MESEIEIRSNNKIIEVVGGRKDYEVDCIDSRI